MKRSKFSLSNYKLFTSDMGELVPCGLTEVLPGDSIQQATSALVRCSPLLAPVMHPVRVDISHWFVPHRLVWDNWEKFITGGPDGMDASVFPTISFPAGGPEIGTLADYLGVPTDITGATAVSALPFRGYAMIWNEHFRDQDLQTSLAISTADGNDITTSTALQNCNWERDYLTSARPWEQKGPAITIPLGQTAPVVGIGWNGSPTVGTNETSVRESNGANRTYPFAVDADSSTGVVLKATTGTAASTRPEVFADLSGASAVTVNILREAMALQRYEEARARYGSRYVEYLRYLGVRSSDARLQRPEYLGGGTQTIQFSEVLQTAEGTDPVGDLKGHGISAGRSNRFRRYIEEHGYIFSFITVKPKTMYSQGLARHWNRRTKEDFFQKELQHIGQQEILNKEVYASHTNPNGIFGFGDRYDEYRRNLSTVSGEFRTTLDFWHLARTFTSDPALNATFVKAVPSERIFAVPSTDVLWIMAKHSIQARRIVSSNTSSFIS